VSELLSDDHVEELLAGIPRLALVAIAARAGRYAERVLHEDWLRSDLHDAVNTLLTLAEGVAHRVGTGAPVAGEEAFEIVSNHWRGAPRAASWYALQSVRDAFGTAMLASCLGEGASKSRSFLQSARSTVCAARDAWKEGLLAPVALAMLGLEQRPREGEAETRAALAEDIVRVRKHTTEEGWTDATVVAPSIFR